jgi:WXG100 family type VII secretion target
MPNLNVTYADMEQMASRLKAAEIQITGDLQNLQGLVNQLVSSGYVTDKSSVAFEHSYTEFNNGAKKMMQGLTGLSKYLTTAHQTLSQADQQLAQSLGNG